MKSMIPLKPTSTYPKFINRFASNSIGELMK